MKTIFPYLFTILLSGTSGAECCLLQINNAGIVKTGNFSTCTFEDVEEAMSINCRGLFMMTKKALPWLNGAKGVFGLLFLPGILLLC